MTDIFSPEKRSSIMSAVKGKDTKPELLIRKSLFAKGFRYKIHVTGLPGKPDIVFPKYKAVIFIHGCFWHNHSCKRGRLPKSNRSFWKDKIGKNKARDKNNINLLLKKGWKVLIIWECFVKGRPKDAVSLLLEKVSEWIIHGNKRTISENLLNYPS